MAELTKEAIAFLKAVDAEAKAAGGGKAGAAVRNKYRAMDPSNKNKDKAAAAYKRQSSPTVRTPKSRVSTSGSGMASSSSPNERSIGRLSRYVLTSTTGGPGGGPTYAKDKNGNRILKKGATRPANENRDSVSTTPNGTMRRFNSNTNKYETWDTVGKKWK